jgi:hypothetical protein
VAPTNAKTSQEVPTMGQHLHLSLNSQGMATQQHPQIGNPHLNQALRPRGQRQIQVALPLYMPSHSLVLDLRRPAPNSTIRTITHRHMASCLRRHHKVKRAMRRALKHNQGLMPSYNISLFILAGMRRSHIIRHTRRNPVDLHNPSRRWIPRK